MHIHKLYACLNLITVTLSSSSGDVRYRGLLVQGRRLADMSPVGSFSDFTSTTRQSSCTPAEVQTPSPPSQHSLALLECPWFSNLISRPSLVPVLIFWSMQNQREEGLEDFKIASDTRGQHPTIDQPHVPASSSYTREEEKEEKGYVILCRALPVVRLPIIMLCTWWDLPGIPPPSLSGRVQSPTTALLRRLVRSWRGLPLPMELALFSSSGLWWCDIHPGITSICSTHLFKLWWSMKVRLVEEFYFSQILLVPYLSSFLEKELRYGTEILQHW